MEETNVKSLNEFKLGLYMGDDIVCETIFDADCYNPYVRYSVDIRKYLGEILNTFKKTLSKDCDTNLNSEYLEYDFFEYYKNEIEKYSQKIKNYYEYKPVKNIELKFVLYINENTVVERLFTVNKLKYDSLYSTNIINIMSDVRDLIREQLRENDIKMMWEDYDIINRYNLNIQQIREMSERERKSKLYKIYNN